MSVSLVCLAFGPSLDDQRYPESGPGIEHPGDDYARAVFGPFDDVRVCYESVQVREWQGWRDVAVWDGLWWRIPYRPDLPGFSDVEIREGGDA